MIVSHNPGLKPGVMCVAYFLNTMTPSRSEITSGRDRHPSIFFLLHNKHMLV